MPRDYSPMTSSCRVGGCLWLRLGFRVLKFDVRSCSQVFDAVVGFLAVVTAYFVFAIADLPGSEPMFPVNSVLRFGFEFYSLFVQLSHDCFLSWIWFSNNR